MNHNDIKELVKKELIESIFNNQEFYVVGNWKMNKNRNEVIDFLEDISNYDFGDKNNVVIIPQSPYLYLFEEKLRYSKVEYGIQNTHFESNGAFTGELSYRAAIDFGARYAIIGHSERREIFMESDDLLSRKLESLVKTNIRPIFCIGENLETRNANKYRDHLMMQLREGLKRLDKDELKRLIIAYEPIWAIGTGVNATPDQVEETHKFLRKYLTLEYGDVGKDIPLLYGGSVKPDNVRDLALAQCVSGFLIGGASLKAESFIRINDILNGK
ncbi:MAG: triose-phosphate isomerase [Bacilli bacterium]|nr:triose-phosphate isomerase [Bacilli bacterium]